MNKRAAPGFGLSLGITLAVTGLMILLPLVALVVAASAITFDDFIALSTSPRAFASYRLTFGAAAVAATLNAIFGFVTAWVLVRYRFFGRSIVDAVVDLPFALPTAVAGLALCALYAKTGPLGSPLARAGVDVAFTPAGVVVALTFIGLPFVVRTLQPVIEQLDPAVEEAAAMLGASRAQTFVRVVLPAVLPAWLTGFTLALARGIGEYGSVVFIAGNMPLSTEITPLLIVTRLEQYDVAGATALALVMLAASFALLLASNLLQRLSRA
ncbi:MAG: sulfate ABC transporter permease subunit CysT [Deltaproteobacteria bacterium]|nr:sulfate ABC transporter permease subunit CysT [Deltaproteobacteria bacterium]